MRLPLEAVQEALDYYHANKKWIDAETDALGRRLGYTDMPAVRSVVREAAAADYRLSAFVIGIVNGPAFRMKSADVETTMGEDHRF